MRYFIFQILLVVPLLLTAQSKKNQIIILNEEISNLRDSVNMLIGDLKVEYKLHSETKARFADELDICRELKDNKVQELTVSRDHNSHIQKQLDTCLNNLDNAQIELDTCISNLENTQLELLDRTNYLSDLAGQLFLSQIEVDSLQYVLSEGIDPRKNVIEMLLKYDGIEASIEEDEEGSWETCFIDFSDYADGSWDESFSFNCVDWYFGNDKPSLIEGKFYVVSVCLVSNQADYTEFGMCSARFATPEEIESGLNW